MVIQVFVITKIKEVVRVPPEMLNMDISEAARSILNSKYSNHYDEELGIVIGVLNAVADPIGKILHGDGASYHWTEAEIFSLKPYMNEVVMGVVFDVKEFGLFVRIGPIEGFVHKSQISDEFVEYDSSRPAFILKQSHRTIEKGDVVRARVIAFGYNPERKELKIQLTMRQPYLGKISVRGG